MGKLKREPEPITWEVHDNFDGSANCVECHGDCILKGANKLLTEFLRWEFEAVAISRRGFTPMAESTIERALGGKERVAHFLHRAVETERKSTGGR